MKTLSRISAILFAMILVVYQLAYADFNAFSGTWSGLFMDQFKIELRFSALKNGKKSLCFRHRAELPSREQDKILSLSDGKDNGRFVVLAS